MTARRSCRIPYLAFVCLGSNVRDASSWAINTEWRFPLAPSSENMAASKVLFATHHKTGTLLAKQVSGCLNRHNLELEANVSNHYEGEATAQQEFGKILHLVRNPVSIIVSSFLYHRDKGERWGSWRGSAKSIVNTSFMGKGEIEVGDRETYKELLNRVSLENGLLIELRRFLRPPSYPGQESTFGHEALQMRAAHKACKESNGACLELCLEDFTRGTTSFNASWQRALEHMGIDYSAPQLMAFRRCVSQADVHGEQFKGHHEHMTANSVSPGYRAKLEHMVRKLDAQRQDRAITLLEEEVGCH